MRSSASKRILMVTSELFPYAKAGGLADVVPELARGLANMGHDVAIVLPRYYFIDRTQLEKLPAPLGVPMGSGEYWVGVHRSYLPGTKIAVYFIDREDLYGRDGIYGSSDEPNFHDNLLRFALLCRASLQLCKMLDWWPDIVQAHDWPAAPVLAYLSAVENRGPLATAKRVLTIHNLGYQGTFSSRDADYLDLSEFDLEKTRIRDGETLNFLKAGIWCADGVTTVSPGYAEEILQPKLGFGLDDFLRAKKQNFVGILNGMDYSIWNPSDDPHIPHAYDGDSMEGKRLNKAYLQELCALPVDPKIPLVGIVSRLVTQKGFAELVADDGMAIRTLCGGDSLNGPIQLVILGTGEKHIELKLVELSRQVPNLRVYIRYNERWSHLIEAGSDFFLMPSLYEPCGLTQMYALRYGTVPIVSPTGGLKDTVIDYAVNPAKSTGFYLPATLDSWGIVDTIRKAVRVYTDKPDDIAEMRRRGMSVRFDWKSAAKTYSLFFSRLADSG